MNNNITILEFMAKGGDIYNALNVDRETKCLIRESICGNLAVDLNSVKITKENTENTKNTIDTIDTKSTKDTKETGVKYIIQDLDDYMLYRRYMLEHGGVPSIADYHKAIEYYMKRA